METIDFYQSAIDLMHYYGDFAAKRYRQGMPRAGDNHNQTSKEWAQIAESLKERSG